MSNLPVVPPSFWAINATTGQDIRTMSLKANWWGNDTSESPGFFLRLTMWRDSKSGPTGKIKKIYLTSTITISLDHFQANIFMSFFSTILRRLHQLELTVSPIIFLMLHFHVHLALDVMVTLIPTWVKCIIL